jgi:A/G-specific adenine glycosylase
MDFSKVLILWYKKAKRDLPWRKTRDPYQIWLSEVILQQTRVTQGLPYYLKFIKKFPTVHHLAKATEEEVMKAWQGLGYYSRARNLHFTAKYISKKLGGMFPSDYEKLKNLKGIGEYTAAAIASFAFNLPYPVVDGNVFRALSRIFGITVPIDSGQAKKIYRQKAAELMDKKNPGLFNQAIMEFGALQCVSKNPQCSECPLKKMCKAYSKNMVSKLPLKSKKAKTRKRYFNYLVICKNGKILVRKRIESDIWKNLYDFPLIETKHKIRQQDIVKHSCLGTLTVVSASPVYKHVLSHQVIFAKFWHVRMDKNSVPRGCFYVHKNKIAALPFPKLIERYLAGILT